ncbi:dihydrofolate reductase family protein [Paenibacillus piri]|uniref:dihydrofolate reductase family protein n=1 Tax=Paenibacillus piri TaxID=2547395 RepID=UPI002482AA1A|nr:dihydrofolate reductase family protein [Paenibacillus piri]
MKQEPGPAIPVAGSGALVRALMRYDLIDEYRLMIHTVALGSGQRFFAGGIDKKVLRLVAAEAFRTGNVVLTTCRRKNHDQGADILFSCA